jgi:hypothetical protein
MRKINFDEFMEEKKRKYFKAPALLGRKRMARRKPRDGQSRAALIMFDYRRSLERAGSGEIAETAPRKYRVKL